MALQYNDSTSPVAGEEKNEGGAQNVFTQEQDEISANVCDGLCMCMCMCMFICMLARPRGVSGQWGPFYSVPRVGVLGWLRPMVLHNQPAKSTSSTSDRLINV